MNPTNDSIDSEIAHPSKVCPTKYYDCDVCGKHFSSVQARSMHKRRSHTTLLRHSQDIDELDNRITFLKKRVIEFQNEIGQLQQYRSFVINNKFTTIKLNLSRNIDVDDLERSLSMVELCTKSVVTVSSIEDMHIFDACDILISGGEFITHEQFRECMYSPVRILQLSKFNPEHPEHMNMLMIPGQTEFVYILDHDRTWKKVSMVDTLLDTLLGVVARIRRMNPNVEAATYDGVSLADPKNRIVFNAIAGIIAFSPIAIGTLQHIGIQLPSELHSK